MQQGIDPDYDPYKVRIDSIDRDIESSGNRFYPTVSEDNNDGYTAGNDNDGEGAVNVLHNIPP